MKAWDLIVRLARRSWFHFKARQLRDELVEEIELHAAFKLREHSADGLPSKAAADRTHREMGNATLAVEQSLDVLRFNPVEQLMQDIRFALRLLVKNPGFTLIAVASLALGIAGNIAMFSMVHAVLLQPLPFYEPQRLVRITEFYPKALLVHYQQQCRTMEVASVSPGLDMNVSGAGPAFRITVSAVSANLFTVLGVSPALGRTFERDEDQPSRDRVVVLSHHLWRSRFNSDRAVIGRVIRVDGIDREIVGVMASEFVFPSSRVQLWIPAVLDASRIETYWGGEYVPLIGRLHGGVTIAQANSEIHSLAANVWTLFPFPMPHRFNANARVVSLHSDLASGSRMRLLLLLAAVGAVLLIACANVASLLLARATARRKEIALRAALGAGRFRIIRQLLTESALLAGLAGVVGLVGATWALSLFRVVIPSELPGAERIAIDWQMAAFALGLALITGLAFGLVPAIDAARLSLAGIVKTGARQTASGNWTQIRSWLIGGEIALTLVLVVAAGLLIRSLHAFAGVDPGFNPQRVLSMKVSQDASFCKERTACVAYYQDLLLRSRQISGVVDAAVANTVPLDGIVPAIPADMEDHPKSPEFPAPMVWAGAVTPAYLRLMNIPVLSGRGFTESDGPDAAPVVLITDSTARRFWPGQNPVGKHMKAVWESRWRTIVGVVADVRQHNLENRPPSWLSGAVYIPYAQSVQADRQIPSVMHLVIKVAGDEQMTGEELRKLVVASSPGIPVGGVVPLESLLDESTARLRSITVILLSFACSALILAGIGTYGLVSYSVAQRRYEIGIRMAVGATNAGIVRMILQQSLRISLLGVAAGLAVSVVLARTLPARLFGVSATDPLTFGAASCFLVIVAATAAMIPAWSSTAIDPIRTLRSE